MKLNHGRLQHRPEGLDAHKAKLISHRLALVHATSVGAKASQSLCSIPGEKDTSRVQTVGRCWNQLNQLGLSWDVH